MSIDALGWGDSRPEAPRLDGKALSQIRFPATPVNSLTFGGKEMPDMYVCAANNSERGGTIFRLRFSVAGLPTPLAAT